jgi:endonuclease/exonuclease/phosphatase family metal-dependent hydrolase
MTTKKKELTVLKSIMLGLLFSLLSSASFAQDATQAQTATMTATVAAASSGSDIKVMNWNILGGRGCKLNRRMEKVADEVVRHKALDVIALEEVHRAQALKLAELLERRGFGFFTTHFVKMKDCGDRNPNADFGIALLSRHGILSRREYELPHAPDPDPETGKACDRGSKRMLAAITIRVRGKLVNVYSTHLTACGGSSAQIEQAEKIIDIIRREETNYERSSRFPFRPLLLGDMNAFPLGGAHSVFTIRFRDAWGNHQGGLTFHTLNPRARIDYIFYGKSEFKVDDISVTSNQTLFRIFGVERPEDLSEDSDDLPVPDHLPVTARLSYK